MTEHTALSRREFIAGSVAGSAALLLSRGVRAQSATQALVPASFEADIIREAQGLEALRTMIVARNGQPVIEHVFRGPSLDRGVNVKSASKSVLSALVGIAIDRKVLRGTEQPIAPLFPRETPANPDPRMARITVGNLLSMQAGLERTSGPNYGRWVESRDWVRFALSQPFVDEPGGRMLYSTGNSHLLSAALTRLSQKSTLTLAREWLGEPLAISIPAWPTDPRGIYFGGNDMVLSPRALLAFGELYRNGGRHGGRQVVPAEWIKQSWQVRTYSPWNGEGYGYGWFTRTGTERPVHYAWGYGGQMVYVIPSAGVTVVMTSDTTGPSARNGYVQRLHALVDRTILPGLTGEPVNPQPI